MEPGGVVAVIDELPSLTDDFISNTTGNNTDDHNLYSDFQNRLLSFLPAITAIPSWLGSALIVYVIVRERRELLKHTYHRIMLGLSIFDFLFSIHFTVFAGVWNIPKGASDYVVGARASTFVFCDIEGVFMLAHVGTVLYTMNLMMFYLLRLHCEWTATFIAYRIEPGMHLIGIGTTLGLGFLAVLRGWSNPLTRLPGVCYIHEFPTDCDMPGSTVECLRGADYDIPLLLISGIVGLSVVIMVISMFLLIKKVRRIEARLMQYAGGVVMSSTSMRLSHTRDTAVRGLLYVISFFLFSSAATVYSFLDVPETEEHRSVYFTLSLWACVFVLNQGSFNAIIYLRPHFRKRASPTGTLFFLRPIIALTDRYSFCKAIWACTCLYKCSRLLEFRLKESSLQASVRDAVRTSADLGVEDKISSSGRPNSFANYIQQLETVEEGEEKSGKQTPGGIQLISVRSSGIQPNSGLSNDDYSNQSNSTPPQLQESPKSGPDEAELGQNGCFGGQMAVSPIVTSSSQTASAVGQEDQRRVAQLSIADEARKKLSMPELQMEEGEVVSQCHDEDAQGSLEQQQEENASIATPTDTCSRPNRTATAPCKENEPQQERTQQPTVGLPSGMKRVSSFESEICMEFVDQQQSVTRQHSDVDSMEEGLTDDGEYVWFPLQLLGTVESPPSPSIDNGVEIDRASPTFGDQSPSVTSSPNGAHSFTIDFSQGVHSLSTENSVEYGNGRDQGFETSIGSNHAMPQRSSLPDPQNDEVVVDFSNCSSDSDGFATAVEIIERVSSDGRDHFWDTQFAEEMIHGSGF